MVEHQPPYTDITPVTVYVKITQSSGNNICHSINLGKITAYKIIP